MGPLLAALVLGAVTVKSEPAAVTLGKDSAAQLEVLAEGAERVTVTASAGTVGPVESLGAGKFKARFTPPADKHPQVALILAEVEIKGERSFGWYALVLKARATLDIDTKPRAKVTAKVGTETFGPAVADARDTSRSRRSFRPAFPARRSPPPTGRATSRSSRSICARSSSRERVRHCAPPARPGRTPARPRSRSSRFSPTANPPQTRPG